MNLTFDQYKAMCGIYYGFPECCIRDYLGRKVGAIISEERINLSAPSGFFPCEKHARILIETGQPINSIIINRQAEYEFPLTVPSDIRDIWIAKNLNKYKDYVRKIIRESGSENTVPYVH